MSALSATDRKLLERIAVALEALVGVPAAIVAHGERLDAVSRELTATREILETQPDRRDLLESFVAAALVLSPDPLKPEQLAEGVAKVSDAVWEKVHGTQAPKRT